MAFNPLEYLRNGKVDFVFNRTPYDYKHLIESVRKAPNRIEIINGFLSKLKNDLPSFCFSVIYDIPEFVNEAYELLNIKSVTPEMLNDMLYNSPLGFKILKENFELFTNNEEYFNVVVKYAFNSNNKELLHILSRYFNLHTRFQFMNYLIDQHPEMIDIIYDDITKYMTSVTYEPYEQLTYLPILMDQKDVSKLAVKLLRSDRKEDYEKLKDYILEVYESNNLASELLDSPLKAVPGRSGMYVVDEEKKELQLEAFNKDANELFNKSANYRFHILFHYKDNIDKELLDTFSHQMRYFLNEIKIKDYPKSHYQFVLKTFERKGLVSLLKTWTEKYMDLSNSKDYGFIGSGTTCVCYRIGDYVVKLVNTKWSYEDEICPNIYLIAKNYEEIYIRDEKGIVESGLEVQKYLTRSVKDIDPKYFRYFDLALDRLGYYRTDTLTKGPCGENAMLLDTYRDADCSNPEKVPVWFRKYPIVLVDRDRIYSKEKKYIKQLSDGYCGY